jgi:DNA repair exonuclease SbcCD ATPase subunit
MESPNFYLILAWEAFTVALAIAAVLLFQNRKMRSLINKLQTRMHELVEDIKKAREEPAKKAPAREDSYLHYINQHLEQTKKHHFSFRGGQDIMLDLDPEVPLPRRTAALRHAILIAEKESHSQILNKTNWDLLAARYQQLLDYNKAYDSPAAGNSGDLEQLREELETSRKRISNLEKFKTLYFDLEKSWRESKGKANEYYTEMSDLITQGRAPEELAPILQNYHTVYSGFNDQLEAGVDVAPIKYDEQSHKEIIRLRNVTVDQHRTINDLQEKLSRASTDDQRANIIKDLQGELQKQARYMQESETCIKLMEDELRNANKEVEQLRARAAQVGQFRTRIKELQSAEEANQHIIQSLKQDNRRLNQKLKTISEAAPEDNNETRALRRELTSVKAKFAELEERYLDLKLKG